MARSQWKSRTLYEILCTTTHWKQGMYQFLRNYRATPHFTTGVVPATALFGRPIRVKLPNPVAVPSGEGHDPETMRRRSRDAQKKLRIKSQAESRRAIKDCDIQVGDTVLVRQPKRGKLSTPYHPTPLTVTKKNHSMLTAKSADWKMTRNSSHFKKLLADDSTPWGRDSWPRHRKQLSFQYSSLSPGVYRLTSEPRWKCWDPDWTCASKVCTCICAAYETHSRDLMMIHSFKMMLNIYSMNILYANFKVIQIFIYGHCLRIMNFESVRAFSSWTFSG